MSIERLNKAASAAGFAMATPDDEAVAETPPPAATPEASESKALALPMKPQSWMAQDAMASVSGWVKSCLPAIGWRAPA